MFLVFGNCKASCRRRFRPVRGILSAALISAVGCGDRSRDGSDDEPVASPAASAYFTDITEQSGLRFSVNRAASGTYFMPDDMAAGCALFDYDNDGDLDVYIVNGFRAADGRIDRVRGAIAPVPQPATRRSRSRVGSRRRSGRPIGSADDRRSSCPRGTRPGAPRQAVAVGRRGLRSIDVCSGWTSRSSKSSTASRGPAARS